MGYYRGDGTNYYRGDYYRGDPFLGALVGGVVGKLAGKAGAWVGRQLGGRAAGGIARDAATGAVAGAAGYTLGQRNTPTLSPLPTLGPLTAGPVGPGSGMVVYKKKGRRMNPLNPRALRRALRRAEGFEKFAARTVNSLYRVIDGRKVRTYKKRTRAT